jgi:coenzyme F420-reducing hydrogenase beta subunit
MQNIKDVYKCYGCGVCAAACGRNIIVIELNESGFYEPRITDECKCSHCGICTEVCAYLHNELSLKDCTINSYAAWSKDHLIRRKCSSGGAGFEIGKYLIGQGYKVCGVRYDAEKNRAEHYIASTVDELVQSAGSKYIQSYTVDGFKAINRKEKYLVTGTPCQIDSFRRYIQRFHCEDNFVLLDFFCHGVPSMLLWKKYTEWAEKKVGKITYASWRNKWTGWHDSWAMGIDGKEHGVKIDWHDSYDMLIREKKSYIDSRRSQGDMFYSLFLGDCCLGKQCFEKCKYKYDCSSADIRIGDLWGNTYKDNEDGVSCAIAFTEKGDEVLKHINCELVSHPFSLVAEGQMKDSPKYQSYFEHIMDLLKNDKKTIDDACHYKIKFLTRQRRIAKVKRLFFKYLKFV